ncbi:MAG TPA: peptide ABC transporter substrate-binding protein [Rhizomicrobium sp.]|nr:peptide ABC transporter substrate-binding protein [Rhizomicrobium sp.]
MNDWTRRGLVAGGASLALAAGACRPRGKGPGMTLSTADALTLSRGNSAEPDTIDPHKASGNWENNIIGDLFMGLMTDAPDAGAIPGAAESFSASADGLTYTFKLRAHSWSDGKPVTADDFVYSFRRMANPKTAAQYVSILYPMKNMQEAASGRASPDAVGARALDARTLELSFNYQVPYIRELLTHYTTFAVPRHVVEKYGEDWTRAEHIVGNGPYVLKEWLSNDHIRLKKNARFYDAANVAIENVYFYPTQDSSAALKRFRAGEFDLVTDSVPPQQITWLERYFPNELKLAPYILSQYLQFNLHRRPFDDLRVRQALSLAIDREIIVAKVTRAGEQPAYALIPPGMPNYQGGLLGFHSEAMAQRMARARALLAAAGHGPGNPVTFDLNTSNATESRIVSVALQGMWADIGVQARLAPYDSQIHYNMLRKRDFDVTWAGWIADFRDPKNYLTLFQTATTDLNYGGYSNPAFDALVDRSDNERDPAARAILLRQAEQMLLDDVAVAPGYFAVTRNLVSPQVKGFVGNNVNVHRTRYLSLDRNNRTV